MPSKKVFNKVLCSRCKKGIVEPECGANARLHNPEEKWSFILCPDCMNATLEFIRNKR